MRGEDRRFDRDPRRQHQEYHSNGRSSPYQPVVNPSNVINTSLDPRRQRRESFAAESEHEQSVEIRNGNDDSL